MHSVPLHIHTFCDDLLDRVSFISSYCLNLSYGFMGLSDKVLHPEDVYPCGPYLFVSLPALSKLVCNFHFLTLKHLKVLGESHGVFVGRHRPKSSVADDFKNHQCNSSCNNQKSSSNSQINATHMDL